MLVRVRLVVFAWLVCLPFCASGTDIVVCAAHYMRATAVCTMTTRPADKLLRIRSNVVSGGRLLVGGVIDIDDKGVIKDVACGSAKADAVDLDCPGSLVVPGLVNLHEHLNYSADPPLPPPTHPLVSRYEWQKDPQLWPGQRVRKTVDPQELSLIELRHLLAGTTALAGRDAEEGLLRNLDEGANKVVTNVTFPFGQQDADLPADCSASPLVDYQQAVLVHVGEGLDKSSRNEIQCMIRNWQSFGGAKAPLTLVQAIATDDALAEAMASNHVGVVWSPVSNERLYGATAPVDMLRKAGVDVSLGSDWLASGSPSLKEEAQFVRLRSKEGKWHVSDDSLLSMLTQNPAASIGQKGRIGDIAAGASADLFAVALAHADPRMAVTDFFTSTAARTQWVMVQGRFKLMPVGLKSLARQHHWVTDDCVPLPLNSCLPTGVICSSDIVLSALKRSDAVPLLCPVYQAPTQ
jgi:large repetitive protein